MSLLRMRWANIFFAHWAVEPETVDAALPKGLTADTYDGTAYLGVVGFRMSDIRPVGVPVSVARSFPELNLRTYVHGPDGPGIYFFNLDADDWLGVGLARRLFKLPYYRAEMTVKRSGDGFRFRSDRTHEGVPEMAFDGVVEPTGTPAEQPPDSLAAFLTERYRFYAASDGGQLYAGTVEHPRWRLQPATLTAERNDLFTANGFKHPDGDPLVHYSPGTDVDAGRIRRVTPTQPRTAGTYSWES